jgi:hypothetical protein
MTHTNLFPLILTEAFTTCETGGGVLSQPGVCEPVTLADLQNHSSHSGVEENETADR